MKGFGSSTPKSSGGSSAPVETLIGRQTEILGDVRFTGGLHVDGKIKGGVFTLNDQESALWVSESGVIEGDVTVSNFVLNGAVTGDVHTSERLTLAARAKITGNVHYKLLQMEPGAMVNGQLVYVNPEAAALTHQRDAGESAEPGREDTVLNLHEQGQSNTV